MKRGEKIEKIMAVLSGNALLTIELLDQILGSYHRSYKAAKRILYEGSTVKRKTSSARIGAEKVQQFYALLNKLKRQGFIVKKEAKNGKTLWQITASGLKKLKLLRENKTDYEIVNDDKLKIIIFDIPERERIKRYWLRERLKMLGFKILQKSVWIGKNMIPERFLFELREKGLLNCVHVLEISKSGTVRELI